MRIRKNIDCLTTDELHDLREAYQALYDLPDDDPNSYHALASLHGGPPVVPGGPNGYCIHWSQGFLTWHRAYLMAFEDALRRVGCGVALPYWDWSSGPNQGVPAACQDPTYVNRAGDTVSNPLYSAPKPGGTTSRGPNANTVDLSGVATQAQSALQAPDFATFQSLIDSPHGSVHGLVGGDMGSVPTAGFDPVFWLHHCNVDRLWARWQTSHPGPLPAGEATVQLDPFNRPYTQQWLQGSDMESITELGYSYRTFCFYIPWRFDLPLLIERRPWLLDLPSIRLVVHAERMQTQPMMMEVRVGDEKAAKTVLAGHIGFMGHPHAADGREAATTADARTEAIVEVSSAGSGRRGHSHGHDHGHDHGGAHGDVAQADGVMLVRPQETEARSHATTTKTTHAGGAGDAPVRRFAKAVELVHALRELGDGKEDVAVHLQVRDANGRRVPPEEFHHTRLELVAD